MTAMVYDAANRMVSMTDGTGEITYAYDADGNLIEKDGKTERYAYDAADRLTQHTGMDGTQTAYHYSASGLLLGKETDGVRISYVYDILPENAQVHTETTDGTMTRYTYGLERISAYEGTSGIQTSYSYDLRGSVAGTYRADTGAKTSHCYTPFGEQITGAGAGTPEAGGFLYNAELYDPVNGSYYLRQGSMSHRRCGSPSRTACVGTFMRRSR